MLRLFACVLAGAISLIADMPQAWSEPMDASTVTCQQLTESGNEGGQGAYGASVILYWMAGYHTTDDQDTVVDFDNLVKEMAATVDFCAKNPAISVMKASAKFMGENSSEPSGKAIDLSIIKCEQVNSSKPDDAEGLGQILMWLSGYHKSTGETTIIDMDEFAKSVDKMAEYCKKNPQIGLYTASEKFMSDESDGTDDSSDDNSDASDDNSEDDASDAK